MSFDTTILEESRLLLFALASGSYPAAAPAFDPANDTVETFDLKFKDFEGPTEVLNPDRAYLGAGKEIYVAPHGKLTFKTRLAGSGVLGEAPPIGKLLRAAGWSETIDATPGSESVTYALLHNPLAGSAWGSARFARDMPDGTNSQKHDMHGVRGGFSLNMQSGNTPMLDWTLLGISDQTPVVSVLDAAADYSAWEEGYPANAANTTAFSIDSFAACFESLTINPGMSPEYRDVLGGTEGTDCAGVIISNREGSGSVVIEDKGNAVKDFYALARTHAIVDVQAVHRVSAVERCTINLKAQLKLNENTGSQSLSMLPFDLRLVPTSPDNEMSMVFSAWSP